MQIEAMYNRGRLEFVAPVRFLRERFPVRVEVPEHVLAGSPEREAGSVPGGEDEWLVQLAAIKERVLRLPPEELPPATEKQEARARAFALREDA